MHTAQTLPQAALPLTVAALLALAPGVTQASEIAASPVPAADEGLAPPGSLSRAHLEGNRLTVTASCTRDGQIEARVAGFPWVTRKTNCERGQTQALVRLPAARGLLRSRAVTLIVRAGGRATSSLLRFPGRSGAQAAQAHSGTPVARTARWSRAHAVARCEWANHTSNGNRVIDIGLTREASFGLPTGTRFAWESWIYYINDSTRARGYQRAGMWHYIRRNR